MTELRRKMSALLANDESEKPITFRHSAIRFGIFNRTPLSTAYLTVLFIRRIRAPLDSL